SPSAHLRDSTPFPTRRSSDLSRSADPEVHAAQLEEKAARVERLESAGSSQLEGEKAVQNGVLLDQLLLVSGRRAERRTLPVVLGDRKSTRLNSSHVAISYAVF